MVIIAIPASVLLFLQNKDVQTFITKKVTEKISENLETHIEIDKVSITFFNRIQIREIFIEDFNGDSILYAEKLKLTIGKINRNSRQIKLNRLTFDEAKINFQSDSSGILNLTYFIDLLKNPDKPKDKKWKPEFNTIVLNNSNLQISRFDPKDQDKGINFENLKLNKLNTQVNSLNISGDSVSMKIDKLSFEENSGFIVNDFSSYFTLSKNHMRYTNTHIETPYSYISLSSLRLGFNDYQDFKDFIRIVDTEVVLRSSEINFRDIGYFSGNLSNFNEKFRFSGRLSGTINNLSGDKIILGYNDHTMLYGNFNIIGLPDIDQTFMHYNIMQFQTNIEDIRMISLPGNKKLSIPKNLQQLGLITYNGKFTGYYDDFVAYGTLGTDLGLISTDLLIKPDSMNTLRYLGNIKTRDFEIGKIIENQDDIGKISMNANVDGFSRAGELSAELSGKIDSLNLFNYTYKNINLSGFLTDKMFDGSFNISDPNIQIDFIGNVDFSDNIPVFDFTADVQRIKPYYLNIYKSDTSYFASFLLKSNFTGKSIDNLNGKIELINSFFQKKDDQIQIYDFTLTAENNDSSSYLNVNSDFLDADMKGYFQFSTLLQSFKKVAAHYLPSLTGGNFSAPDTTDLNNFDFRIMFDKIEPVISFFIPEYSIADSTYIAGNYNPSDYDIKITGHSPSIRLKNNKFSQINFIAKTNREETEIFTNSEKLQFRNEFELENLFMNAIILKDSAAFDINWKNNSKPGYQGNLNFQANLFKHQESKKAKLEVQLLPSDLVFNDTVWHISESHFELDSTAIRVDSFEFRNQNQLLFVNGILSDSPEDRMIFNFKNIDLRTANIFTGKFNMLLNGTLSGKASLNDPYNTPMMLTNLDLTDFQINNEILGSGKIQATWDNANKKIDLQTNLIKGTTNTLSIEGNYVPSTSDIDFDISFDKIRLMSLNPYLKKILSDIKGLGSGVFEISGKIKKPEISGILSLFKTSFTVNYLQTRYSSTSTINIEKNNISFDKLELYDENGNSAFVNGSISTNYFKNIYLDLRLSSDNFTFLNTREKDNDLFFGSIYAGGLISLNGTPENLNLDISARTKRNSVFFIPLYGSEEVMESDFIVFQKSDAPTLKEEDQEKYEAELRGLTMNFTLDVTPEAEVQLIFDPKIGDILRGKGTGNLLISINQEGKFEINGDYIIENGDYLFTLQNVINKRFEVRKGGHIVWSGDPGDADIDLQAIYPLKTSVYPLAPDGDPSLKNRIPVECRIDMTGKLMNPVIQTEIELPTADQQTQNIVNNAINSQEEKMKQFLFLLVTNNFYSDQLLTGENGGGGLTTVNAAGVATSELLSNQLSHWLSQISQDFDIGLNYRPGDEITSDELEVALSTQILNDRITINTNLDVGGNQTTQASAASNTNNIVGDFDLDFQLTENGKLHVKAFNRSNDNLLFETSPYTQGISISYREDFNTFGELLQRYKDAVIRLFSRKRNKKNPLSNKREKFQ